jgi:cyclopropane fatty-acyl-phospholipid synthase-like methyltransferase
MNTKNIWESRYNNGGNSGNGTYNELYIFKRDIINDIINKYNIKNIIDFGCGDGNQIKEFNIDKYVGIDIALSAINICKMKYKDDNTKSFFTYNEINNIKSQYDLSISLDVLYHILEEDLFIDYLKKIFNFSSKYILIYSSNYDGHTEGHMHTRKFTNYVEKLFPNWVLNIKIKQIYPKKSSADFYLYEKKI